MKKTLFFGVACAIAIVSGDFTVADDHSNSFNHDNDTRPKHARLGTVAIPCIPKNGLKFSCSNKSPHRSLDVVDVKCFVGAGDKPEVLSLDFNSGVAPETTEVRPVTCHKKTVLPAFCTAWVYPRNEARCALTSPTGGLNAELK